MVRGFLVCLVAVLLHGCASVETPLDEGYGFGDTTGSLLEKRDSYCDEADDHQRAVLLALAWQAGLSLPANGACADLLEVIDGAG